VRFRRTSSFPNHTHHIVPTITPPFSKLLPLRKATHSSKRGERWANWLRKDRMDRSKGLWFPEVEGLVRLRHSALGA
jgi:hypothetical protein